MNGREHALDARVAGLEMDCVRLKGLVLEVGLGLNEKQSKIVKLQDRVAELEGEVNSRNGMIAGVVSYIGDGTATDDRLAKMVEEHVEAKVTELQAQLDRATSACPVSLHRITPETPDNVRVWAAPVRQFEGRWERLCKDEDGVWCRGQGFPRSPQPTWYLTEPPAPEDWPTAQPTQEPRPMSEAPEGEWIWAVVKVRCQANELVDTEDDWVQPNQFDGWIPTTTAAGGSGEGESETPGLRGGG